MDLRALMQKLETINTKQIVTESVETKKVITESVAVPVRKSADPVFTSSIARSLAEEFGYALDEAAPNDPNRSAAVDANTKAMQANRAAKDGTTVQGSGTTPPPGAAPTDPSGAEAQAQAAGKRMADAALGQPAAAAPAAKPGVFDRVSTAFQKNNEKFAAKQAADATANSPEGMAAAKANLTPSQLKWLGDAQPNPEILRRMPAAQPGEKPAGAAATPAAGGVVDSSGNPVLDGSKQPVATGSATPASTPAAQKVDPNQAEKDDAEQGAAIRANAAGGNSTSAATGVGDPGEEAAAQAAAQAANGVNAAGQNVTMPGGINPETGEPTTTTTGAAAPAAPAAAYKGSTSAQEIAKANGIADPNKIQAGKTITVNGKPYKIQPGDTLDKIAKTQGAAAPAAAAPAAGAKPDELDAVKKNAGLPAAPGAAATPAPYNAAKDSQSANTAPAAASAAAPAAGAKVPPMPDPNFKTGTMAQRTDWIAKYGATNNPDGTPKASKQAAAPTAAAPTPAQLAGKKPAAPAGTTSTQSNQSVQGTMKMGKPDGPITFNGKQVQPGEPEYAAASAALIQAQGGARNFRSRNDQNVERNLAASGAPVSAGAPNVDRSAMENIQAKDDQILAIIRGIRVG